jgi:hypothetical protein
MKCRNGLYEIELVTPAPATGYGEAENLMVERDTTPNSHYTL